MTARAKIKGRRKIDYFTQHHDFNFDNRIIPDYEKVIIKQQFNNTVKKNVDTDSLSEIYNHLLNTYHLI